MIVLRVRRLSFVFVAWIAALFLALAGCGDDSPTGGTPHQIQVEVPSGVQAQAGELLPAPIVVRVIDAAGAGVLGEPLSLSVEAGGGEVTDAGAVTDEAGEARITGWRMGEAPGVNRLRITVSGLEPRTVEVQAGPGPAHAAAFLAEGPGESPVAETLENLPPVQVTDRFGNAVPGAEVSFTPSEGGAVAAGAVTTDAQGTAETPAWTLAPAAGPQTLEARVVGAPAAVLAVESLAGPPEVVGFDTPQDQQVEVGLFVPHVPVVTVTDAHGNGIPDMEVTVTVVAGGGSIEGWDDRTDTQGRARVERWTVGSVPGENRLEAQAPGVGSAELVAQAVPVDAEPVGRYFRVAHVHVNQGNQNLEGEIPLVEGRGGLLRVWVTASEEGAPAPSARIRVYRDADLLTDTLVAPPPGEAPVSVPWDAWSPSWNVHLPGEWVDEGLRVEVDVDPDHEVGVVTRRFGHFPEAGGDGAFATVALDTLRMRVVPLQHGSSGEPGQVNEENLDHFLEQVRGMLPVGEDRVTLGEPFAVELFDQNGILRVVLPEMLAAWAASDFRDHYFHGIFPHQGAAGFSGRALVSPDPAEPTPVAMSYDLFNAGNLAVARGLARNMGRSYVACGTVPGPVDENYPYEGGDVGPLGYDPVERRLLNQTVPRDILSYCAPHWTSDYTFAATLEWTRNVVWNDSDAPGPAAGGGQADSRPGLLVWGSAGGGEPVLEPAFPVEARPRLPARGGPYALRVLDADGGELASISFDVGAVAGDPAGAGAFAWVLPMDPTERDRVARLELVGPEAAAHQAPRLDAVAAFGEGPEAPAAMLRSAAGGQTLEWSPDVLPVVLIRRPDSGEVLGLLRSGRAELSRWSGEVEVILSDGVRGWVLRDGALERVRGAR